MGLHTCLKWLGGFGCPTCVNCDFEPPLSLALHRPSSSCCWTVRHGGKNKKKNDARTTIRSGQLLFCQQAGTSQNLLLISQEVKYTGGKKKKNPKTFEPNKQTCQTEDKARADTQPSSCVATVSKPVRWKSWCTHVHFDLSSPYSSTKPSTILRPPLNLSTRLHPAPSLPRRWRWEWPHFFVVAVGLRAITASGRIIHRPEDYSID